MTPAQSQHLLQLRDEFIIAVSEANKKKQALEQAMRLLDVETMDVQVIALSKPEPIKQQTGEQSQ